MSAGKKKKIKIRENIYFCCGFPRDSVFPILEDLLVPIERLCWLLYHQDDRTFTTSEPKPWKYERERKV